MIASLKEAADDSPTRQEAATNGTTKNSSKLPPSSSASPTNSWLRLQDPQIVRVSRAFGGKDRHSKVCTVRGLRDRRVRLSVPTAIQLYDLQERLGLNQPSKVVDWLLDAAKNEIDELPPLAFPPGFFSFNHQMLLASQPNNENGEATAGSSSRSDFWNPERPAAGGGSSTEAWLNNSVVPFGSVNCQLEPQSFEFPSLATTHEEENNLHLGSFNFMQLPSTLSLSSSSGAHQILIPSNQDQIDPRTISSHLQMLSSASQTNNTSVPPFFSAHQSLIRPFHAQGRNTTQAHEPGKGQH